MDEAATIPGRFPGLKVLFLVDEALVYVNHMAMLEDMGCIVLGCMGLNEAFETIKQQQFEVAILDISVQGQTSYRLAEALERRGTRIVFLTGYQSGRLDWRWRDYPACKKSCAQRDLVAVITKALT
jgi:CheY-like chemotaxis protein